MAIRAKHLETGEDLSRVGPSDLSRVTIVGDPIPLQVRRFVEETWGFREWSRGELSREAFLETLDARLPYEFLGPRQEFCGHELEEALFADLARSAEAIDEKYRRRYPGMMKPKEGE